MPREENWSTSANGNLIDFARDCANHVDLSAEPPDGSGHWFAWASNDEALYDAYHAVPLFAVIAADDGRFPGGIKAVYETRHTTVEDALDEALEHAAELARSERWQWCSGNQPYDGGANMPPDAHEPAYGTVTVTECRLSDFPRSVAEVHVPDLLEDAADFGAAFRDTLRERVAADIERKLRVAEPSFRLSANGDWDNLSDRRIREHFGILAAAKCGLGATTTERLLNALDASLDSPAMLPGEDTIDALERWGVLTTTEVAWLRDAD